MNTIDNIMALADEYAGRSQLTEQGETLSRKALHTALTEALSAQQVREPANWYCIDKTGMATLCADEDDALQNAKLAALDWPNNAPYRAVQLVEAQPVRESLTDDQITTIAHRMATKYTHTAPVTGATYGFSKNHIVDFVRALEAHGIGGDK